MKATLSIIASIYWILYFTYPTGIYFEHLYQLIVALILTFIIAFIECNEEINKTKGE